MWHTPRGAATYLYLLRLLGRLLLQSHHNLPYTKKDPSRLWGSLMFLQFNIIKFKLQSKDTVILIYYSSASLNGHMDWFIGGMPQKNFIFNSNDQEYIDLA